jgi:hypothetical protein
LHEYGNFRELEDRIYDLPDLDLERMQVLSEFYAFAYDVPD